MKTNGTKSSGLSLLEMLVAIALLVVLIALFASMLNHASLTASHFQNKSALRENVRAALDRLGEDVAHGVVGEDVDSLMATQNGNTALYFFSEAPGYFITSGSDAVASGKKSNVSLIGYAIDRDHRLMRLSKGLTWSDAESAFPYLPVRISEKWSDLIAEPMRGIDANSDPCFHVASATIFRFECLVISGSGEVVISENKQQSGFSGGVALCVTVAAIPAELRSRITDWDSLTAMFPFKDNIISPAAQWEAALKQPDFAARSRLPTGVAGHIRIFQRYFPIP